ncbi:Transcriptional regulator, partial [Dysosmobacter welbionis]
GKRPDGHPCSGGRAGRCGGALLRAQGHGRPARQVPEGQAPDGFGQVYRLRRLRPPVSHGGHQSLQRGG